MANLILDGKKLDASITSVLKSLSNTNTSLHLVACSAIMLAVRDGRTERLNKLYDGLPATYQDAFRAWTSPTQKFWFGTEGKDHRWINFEATSKIQGKTPRGFYIMDMKVKPTEDMVNAVADDAKSSFFNLRAQSVAKKNSEFDVAALVKAFETAAARLQKASDEGKVIVSTKLLQQAAEIAVAVDRDGAIRLATVNGVAVASDPVKAETKKEAKVKADLASIKAA